MSYSSKHFFEKLVGFLKTKLEVDFNDGFENDGVFGRCYLVSRDVLSSFAVDDYKFYVDDFFSDEYIFGNEGEKIYFFLMCFLLEAKLRQVTVSAFQNFSPDYLKEFTVEDDDECFDSFKKNLLNDVFYAFIREGRYSKLEELMGMLENVSNRISSTDEMIEKVSYQLDRFVSFKNKLTTETLASGFNKNLEEKIKERKNNSYVLGFFGLVLFFIPAFSFILFSFYPESVYKSGDYRYISIYASLFSMEMVVLYFFRISMVNGNNLKAQILQLSLRVSVSQFLSNYLEDENIQEKNKESIARFEALIFRDISLDGSVPISFFDGLDNVTKAVSVARGKP